MKQQSGQHDPVTTLLKFVAGIKNINEDRILKTMTFGMLFLCCFQLNMVFQFLESHHIQLLFGFYTASKLFFEMGLQILPSW